MPQNPNSLQQTFKGQVFPDGSALTPHSDLALQLDTQSLPQNSGPSNHEKGSSDTGDEDLTEAAGPLVASEETSAAGLGLARLVLGARILIITASQEL